MLALGGLLEIYGAIGELHALEKGAHPPVRPFFQDLREIPASFATRPISQQGASIYGFDSLWLLESAAGVGLLDVFEFKHGAVNREEIVPRGTIVPLDDAFLPVLEEFCVVKAP